VGVLGRHSNVVGGIILQACSCLLAHLWQRAVLATCIPTPLFSASTMSVQQSPIAPGLKSLLTSSEARSQSGTAEQSSSHQLASPAASQAGLYASSSTVPSSSQLPGPSGATSGGCSYIIMGILLGCCCGSSAACIVVLCGPCQYGFVLYLLMAFLEI